ncbi:MAG TPA: hypothetical protein VF586_15115 [Pyrinomonadaceae bacterium]|jgi:hypothetical protein
MLFIVCAWVPLLLVCWLCGAAVLERAAGAGTFRRAGDRLILSLWLGLVVLPQVLIAVSHLAPLTALCGAAVGAAVSGLALLSGGVRAEAARLRGLLRPGLALGLLALALGAAALASQPVRFFDTGLYHFQNIKWLSEYGTVLGAGLVHERFAFTPAWFTLVAPYDGGPFVERVAGVADGFTLLVASLHALVCARRCAAGAGRGSDWLVLLSFAVVLPPILYWRMPASSSPDMPVFFLSAVVAWGLCLAEEARAGLGDGAAAGARSIPLLLAAGAVGVKVNTLPLLVVASVYYVRGGGLTARRVLAAGAAVSALLLPTLAHRFVVSGCPLFPSKLLCLDVPWSVGVWRAEGITRVIREWARWDGSPPRWANEWNWVVPWMTRGFTPKNSVVLLLCLLLAGLGALVRVRTRLRAQGTLLLLAGCAGLLVFLEWRGGGLLMVSAGAAGAAAALTRRGGEFAGRAWVLAAGLAGTALTLYAGPTLRFGLGYTAVLLAALLVPAAVGFAGGAGADEWWRRRATLPALAAACGLLFFTLTVAVETAAPWGGGVGAHVRRRIVPPMLPTPVLVPREVNGLRYSVPAQWEQCWAAEVPCSPGDLSDDVMPRDPARGPGAGFVSRRNGQ